jgi:Pyruvate/2-oxoacid:ferredoxin oxidoreductase gamma subunit
MIDLTTISASPLPEAIKQTKIMNEKLRKQNAIMASAICIGAFFYILHAVNISLQEMEKKSKERLPFKNGNGL